MHEQSRYADAWDRDEQTRKRLMWERAALGAALTLGKHPVRYPEPRFAGDDALPSLEGPIPPPMLGIPEPGFSNWRQVLDEVLDYHGFDLLEVIRKSRETRQVLCMQELCYRLMKYGRWGGRPVTSVFVGRLLRRDHSTILYSVRVHAVRLKRWQPAALSEGVAP